MDSRVPHLFFSWTDQELEKHLIHIVIAHDILDKPVVKILFVEKALQLGLSPIILIWIIFSFFAIYPRTKYFDNIFDDIFLVFFFSLRISFNLIQMILVEYSDFIICFQGFRFSNFHPGWLIGFFFAFLHELQDILNLDHLVIKDNFGNFK